MYNDKDFNLDLIRGMNAIMISMNNEDAYMEWIYTVPDQCTDDDLEEIAEDSELFQETVHEFMRIFNKYSKDGLFIQTTVGDEYIAKVFTEKENRR